MNVWLIPGAAALGLLGWVLWVKPEDSKDQPVDRPEDDEEEGLAKILWPQYCELYAGGRRLPRALALAALRATYPSKKWPPQRRSVDHKTWQSTLSIARTFTKLARTQGSSCPAYPFDRPVEDEDEDEDEDDKLEVTEDYRGYEIQLSTGGDLGSRWRYDVVVGGVRQISGTRDTREDALRVARDWVDDRLEEPEEPEEPDVLEVANELITFAPEPGRLYQVRQGDNLVTIIRRAYGLPQGNANVPRLVRGMVALPWNYSLYRRRYGSPTAGQKTYAHEVNGEFYTITMKSREPLAAEFFARDELPQRGRGDTGGALPGRQTGSSYPLVLIPEATTVGDQLLPQATDVPALYEAAGLSPAEAHEYME